MDQVFDTFLQAFQSPAIIISPTGTLLGINEKAARILDQPVTRLTGKNLGEFLFETGGGKPFHALDLPFLSTRDWVIHGNQGQQNFIEIQSDKLKTGQAECYWITLKEKRIQGKAGTGRGTLPGRADPEIPTKENSSKLFSDSDSAQSKDKGTPQGHTENAEVLKERYRLAAEASQTGVGEFDYKNNVLIIDDSLRELLGVTGHTDNSTEFWKGLIHPEDRPMVSVRIRRYINEYKKYIEITLRIRHRRNIFLWVLCRGKILYDHDKPSRLIFAITDITDKIEATRQLDAALINFRTVFEAFPDQFFRLNKIGDYLEVLAGNPADLVFPDYESYRGKNIKETLSAEVYQVFYKALETSFDSGMIESCEYVLTKNNISRHYEARIKSISESEAIVIVRNITELARINHELVEARKTAENALQAGEDFLSAISHEIRTPLNVVIGMSYLLLQNQPRDDQMKYINTLKFSSTGLINIINDLLDLSKIKSGKLEVEHIAFNLRDLLNNIRDSYRAQFDKRPIEFRMEISPEVPEHIQGDPMRLTQILNNLLNNASKFTEEGIVGLSVSVQHKEGEPFMIEFTVSDTGIGIQPSKIDLIFEPYRQSDSNTYRKYGGTGLGLAIIKQLIESQHGSISVESEPGKGSAFRVQLPLVATTVSDVPEPSVKPSLKEIVKSRNLTILYADDVASNRFLMQGYFDLWGCRLETANNGEDALQKARSIEFDIILMDLQMPVLDGFKASMEIRELSNNNRSTPIIAITGDISGKAKKAILDAGFSDILVKPVNPVHLYEKIIQSIMTGQPARVTKIHEPYPGIQHSGQVNFRQVDLLYGEVPVQYQQLMEMLLKEFEGYKRDLPSVLQTGNFEEFRQIRHSMISSMKLFEMDRLKELLDELRKSLEEKPGQPVASSRIHELVHGLDEVLESFSEKLKSLISP